MKLVYKHPTSDKMIEANSYTPNKEIEAIEKDGYQLWQISPETIQEEEMLEGD